MKRLLITLLVFGFVLYGSAGVIFYFSKENNITDRAAKLFIQASILNDLTIQNSPCDERRAVIHRLQYSAGQHFTHLVIGSSRVMQLGKYTGFKNTLNLGVSGSSFEDLEIILRLVKEKKISFDSLHLDFNPWYANTSNDNRHNRFNFQNNVQEGLKHIALLRFDKSDLMSIMPSMSYTPLACSPDSSTSHIIFKDGSIKQKSHGEEKRIKNLNISIKNLYHKIRDFYTIDEEYLLKVFQFYHEVSQLHPTTIYLSPFHPKLYEAYSKDPRILNIIETEKRFRQNCGDLHFIGSFASQSPFMDVEPEMFLDAMHISEIAVRKYFYHPQASPKKLIEK
ncbi:MAG: hypothetical protein RL106_991 [Bacteroidota bacterium]